MVLGEGPQIMIMRIRKITEELEAIHAEISSQLNPDCIGKAQSLFDEVNAVELLTDFKCAIDQLRSVLWRYIEEVSGQTTEDPALKATHLLRATEMLRALTQQQSSRPLASFQEGSFFDRLHIVMDAYAVDYHCLGQTSGEGMPKISETP